MLREIDMFAWLHPPVTGDSISFAQCSSQLGFSQPTIEPDLHPDFRSEAHLRMTDLYAGVVSGAIADLHNSMTCTMFMRD